MVMEVFMNILLSDEAEFILIRLADCGSRDGLASSEEIELFRLRRDLLYALHNDMKAGSAEERRLKYFYQNLNEIRNGKETFTPEQAIASDVARITEGLKSFDRSRFDKKSYGKPFKDIQNAC
jgi:hypothetical protein